MQKPLVEPWPVWYNKWGHHPSPWAEGVFRCQRWLRWSSFPRHSAASVCSCCAGGWCEAVGVFWGQAAPPEFPMGQIHFPRLETHFCCAQLA